MARPRTQRELAQTLLKKQVIMRLLELREAGVTAATMSRMERAGEVIRLSRGVYQLPDADLDPNHSLAEAAKRAGGSGEVTWAPDPRTQAIVDGWPAQFVSDHAEALGIEAEKDMGTLIADYLNHKEG